MITSHFGAELVPPEIKSSQPFSLINFSGGWAPVLFFFVTGLGYGINSNKPIKSRYWFDVFAKALTLFFVERVAYIKSGSFIGIDFLSFIGIIIVLLSIFRAHRVNHLFILLLILILVVFRYFIGPLVSDPNTSMLVGWLIGTSHMKGFSYPFSPWLIYPFIGYMIGKALSDKSIDLKKYANDHKQSTFIIFTFLVGLILLNGWLRGYVFFRWGTVSFDYFLLSLLVIISFVYLSTILSRGYYPYCSIMGLSSLLVVPIHYYLIDTRLFEVDSNQFMAFFTLGLLVFISIVVAKNVSNFISGLNNNRIFARCIFLFVLITFAVYISAFEQSFIISRTLLLVLQLGICSFFVIGFDWILPASKQDVSGSI